MEKRIILVISLISLFALCLVNFQLAKSQVYTDLITISPDGSIDPPTAPIQHNGDVYILTGDTSGFVVIARNNTIFDGAEHSVQGISGPPAGNATYYNASQVSQCLNLTIVNAVIDKGWIAFIQLSNSTIANNTIVNGRGISWSGSGNIVSGNNITNNNATSSAIGFGGANNTIIGNNITGTNSAGISLVGTGNIIIGNYVSGTDSSAFDLGMASYKNIIIGNQVANSSVGVHTLSAASTYSSQGNVIYYNNFINNTKNVDNAVIMTSEVSVSIWDNGTFGNYWSNYNGSDANGDGIGDIPYTIDSSNVDHYPLMTPINTTTDITAFLPSPTTSPSPSPSPSPTPSPTQTPYLTPTPSPSPTSSPSLTSSPSPSIPELPAFTAVPLLLAVALGVLLFHKKLFKARE